MSDVARTVLVTEEQDAFLTAVMSKNPGLSRSQIVRLALEKLREDPRIVLTTGITVGSTPQSNAV
jgi:hypothetical protein